MIKLSILFFNVCYCKNDNIKNCNTDILFGPTISCFIENKILFLLTKLLAILFLLWFENDFLSLRKYRAKLFWVFSTFLGGVAAPLRLHFYSDDSTSSVCVSEPPYSLKYIPKFIH